MSKRREEHWLEVQKKWETPPGMIPGWDRHDIVHIYISKPLANIYYWNAAYGTATEMEEGEFRSWSLPLGETCAEPHWECVRIYLIETLMPPLDWRTRPSIQEGWPDRFQLMELE